MRKKQIKIRDGFQGEKLISIPPFALQKALPQLVPGQPYITHIGYFPKARYHYRIRRKGCEDNILFYCLHGKGFYTLGNEKFELSANQYVIIPATTLLVSYWADQDNPWTIYWVHFTGDGIGQFNQALGIGKDHAPLSIPYNEEGLKIWNKMYESLTMGYNVENMLHANLCLPHFIATFLYPQKPLPAISDNAHQTLINRTILYMKSNLHKKLTVEDLAGINQLSLSHFSNLFRMSTGMPPIDYFIHLKMQKACQMLHTTDLKIKEVAITLGYDDCYYFSRLFKKCNNVSPEEYRQSIKAIF